MWTLRDRRQINWRHMRNLRAQLPTLARQISNRSFKNKPDIFFILIISIIIANKLACNILNWNHSFIWQAKTSYLLKN